MSLVEASTIALRDLLSGIGFDDAPLDRLEIIDDGSALPTSWPITANAVAALAAVGLAASRLDELRNGVTAPVSISTYHAGLSMACSSYLTVDGKSAKFRDPFTGFYEAANGRWAFLHGNFPHLRDGVLKLLGVTTVDDVARAVRTRDPFDLEALGIANGLCIAAVRTRAEWEAEAQYTAIKALPLIEFERLDNGTPRSSASGGQPLSGLHVVDLSRVIAGPMAGRTIAEFGGDVLLVSGPGLPSIESLVIDTGFGKRSATLDLASPKDRATFEALIAESDVFLDAYRPGSLPGRGYDKAMLTRLRPGLVHIDLDAFSRSGPWAARRGYDSLVQATVGMCWDGENPPENLPCQPLDYLTGYLGALAGMVGLIRRMEQSGSWAGRLSLARTAHWMWNTYDHLGPQVDAPSTRPSIDDARSRGYLVPYDTAFGAIEALRSPLQSPDWRWPAPPAPLGSHMPDWI
tara:strand:+ start:13619 stop:15004 length:1386 start_codon:yes stop_codon:yes gene_type:complete